MRFGKNHSQQHQYFNSFPNDKTLDQSNLKAFSDDKINLTGVVNFGNEWVENIVEKEKKQVTSIFSFFCIVFSEVF